MPTKTVGKFSFDEDTQEVAGPASYMAEKYDAEIAGILAGNDAVFNMTANLSPDPITAILVHLQTDYAGYVGMKQVEGWIADAQGGK